MKAVYLFIQFAAIEHPDYWTVREMGRDKRTNNLSYLVKCY